MPRPTSRTPLLFTLLALGALTERADARNWRADDGREVIVADGRAAFREEPGEDVERSAFARIDEVDWDAWEDLPALLSDVHRRVGVPAIAAAFVRDGRTVARATVGVHEFGSDEAVGPDARFHLGSVTKSFTAAVVGKLVEEGKLAWDTTLGDVLGDFEMRAAYRDVTVEELLWHRGGLPSYTDHRPAGHPDRTYSGSPTEQRATFVADVLQQEPVGTPGETFLYSNAGYAAVGHMAERVAETSWEELVRAYVFAPLGMRQSGFGFPDTPLGHVGNGPEPVPVPTDAYSPMEIIAPAGNIHSSVADLARYASAHLAGLAGRDGFLRSETVRRLHALPRQHDGAAFASGWIVTRDAAGNPVHRHGGSAGASYAEIRLYPASSSATIVLTTVGTGLGEALTERIARAFLQRYRPVPSGFVSIDGEQRAADTPELARPATAEEDARLWRVVGKLSRAINGEDREAYRSLFAPTFDRRDCDSMFDFMASNVLPTRGGIHAFHAPSAPLRVPGSKRTLRPVTFHLENGFPGYFGISLDERDRIVEFSLFVKGDLCPGGTDRHCARNVKTLAEDFE